MITLRLPPLLAAVTWSIARAQELPGSATPGPESAWIGQIEAPNAIPAMPSEFTAAAASPVTPVPWEIDPPVLTFVPPSKELKAWDRSNCGANSWCVMRYPQSMSARTMPVPEDSDQARLAFVRNAYHWRSGTAN